MKTWLVIDASYLCYRALYATGGLRYGEIATGVVFGFFHEVIALQDLFDTTNVAFCFDSPQSLRRKIFPAYKLKRHSRQRTEAELKQRVELMEQMHALRKEYLPAVGYQNIFSATGFESDDCIASLVKNLPDNAEAVIISADNDLLQLLAPGVLIHNPQTRKTQTHFSFIRDYGFEPKLWAKVKAYGGCKSDEVPGVTGGYKEKTAIKFVQGKLKETSSAYQLYTSDETHYIVQRNKKLVKLPFEGTPKFELLPDDLSEAGWKKVMDKLGMKSLRLRAPFAGRRRR